MGAGGRATAAARAACPIGDHRPAFEGLVLVAGEGGSTATARFRWLPVVSNPATAAERMDDIDDIRGSLGPRCADLGLDPERLTVEPVMNPGGFVSHSFRVSDGRASYFLKLAADPEALPGLVRGRTFAPVLERRYRAPHMVGWLDVRPPGRGGPLFEWVDGVTPMHLDAAPLDALCVLVETLHHDGDLASSLARAGDPVLSCGEAYLSAYHERFVADLAFIGSDPPPFVGPELLAWLQDEARALGASVRAAAAFDEPAHRPIHGDLWLNNVLVADADRWYMLDWDGLGLGDPVVDWAMLFGPSRGDVRSHAEGARRIPPLGPGGRQRLRTYARASLLDWIIDPLADWVQAGAEPFFGSEIRTDNERVHREALAEYLERHGGPGRFAG